MYGMVDEDYSMPAAVTFARQIKGMMLEGIESGNKSTDGNGQERSDEFGGDIIKIVETKAIEALRTDKNLMEKIANDGVAWGALKGFFLDNNHVPTTMDNRNQFAFHLVSKAMDEIFGMGGWHSFKKIGTWGNEVRYVKKGRKE
jgi:uncharacterized protein